MKALFERGACCRPWETAAVGKRFPAPWGGVHLERALHASFRALSLVPLLASLALVLTAGAFLPLAASFFPTDSFFPGLGSALSPELAQAAPFTLQQSYLGEQLLDQYGFSVAGAGDVDGDGFDDFLVGANVNDELITSGGKVYLYLGGVVFPAVASFTFAGDREREYLGGAVAAGDLNGDGFSDWAVGAPGGGVDGMLSGRVFVFFGGRPLDAVPDLVLEGLAPGGQFGGALAMDGDLNGDGVDDLAVGAPHDSTGVVYLFFGGSSPSTAASDTLFPRSGDERFGKALAYWKGQGDGRADALVVGAPRSSVAATWAGAALLFRGGVSFDRQADAIFSGALAGDAFGSALDGAADLDADGLPDLLVGAPHVDLLQTADVGRVYLFSASAPLDTVPDRSWTGSWDGGFFGSSVAAGFFWDDDGAADLAVGAPYAGTPTTEEGTVYVYAGGLAPPSAPLDSLVGPVSSSHLGISTANAGDVQHDGRNAMIVGGYNGGDTGRALLYAAPPRGTPAPSRLATTASLSHPWPNPFNPRVQFELELTRRGLWRVEIFDRRGRRVRRLHEGILGEGSHRMIWDGRDGAHHDLPSGVYFVRAKGEAESLVRSLSLIR